LLENNAGQGASNEELPDFNYRSPKIKKTEEGCEEPHFGQHCPAVYGIAASPGADFGGGSKAKSPMSALRQKLARSVYLVAIATAMVGWVWMLLAGLGWVLGA
jgi:hypothetical protein